MLHNGIIASWASRLQRRKTHGETRIVSGGLNRVTRPFFSRALKAALERNSEIGSAQSGISKCAILNFEVCNFEFGSVLCVISKCAVRNFEFESVQCVISKCAVRNFEIGSWK